LDEEHAPNTTCCDLESEVIPAKEKPINSTVRPLAVVIGVSTGIGFELAKVALEKGYDLVIAADEAEIHLRGTAPS
jgi:hypothetical protein